MAIGATVTKPSATTCRSLCTLMYYSHSWCLKTFGEGWPCHQCQMSRGLPKERATSHKHCPPRPRLSCLRPDKASNILLTECSNALHLTAIYYFLTYVSTSICCIKNIGLISIRFTGIDHPHILYTSTKIYANWMSPSSWLLCQKTTTCFACKDLPISVRHDPHFSANGFVTVWSIVTKSVRD